MFTGSLQGLEEQGLGNISRLPFSIKVLLEAAVRQYDGKAITKEHVRMLASWADRDRTKGNSLQARPGRPAGLHRRAGRRRPGGACAIRDGAGRRRSEADQPAGPRRSGHRPLGAGRRVRHAGCAATTTSNMEFERNGERYQFLRWAPEGVRQLPGRAAGDRHRPPGQPRIPGQGGHATGTSDGETEVFPTRSSAPTPTPR